MEVPLYLKRFVCGAPIVHNRYMSTTVRLRNKLNDSYHTRTT